VLEAEKQRREAESRSTQLAAERDHLANKLERLEAEREELLKAKRCDVCDREDEFKFIQEVSIAISVHGGL
jgi:hypothetical protein